jgi:hypothetical protein
MGSSVAEARHEGRHPPGEEPLWGESWYFDFASPDGDLGGYVRLGLYPNLGVAWYWAYLVGTDRPLVAVRDHDVALPRGRTLEVRAEGLWSAINCETPNEHWSIGLEAFGVGMDDPADAYRGERGDRTPLGFDLEWEAAAAVFDYPGPTRYEQACTVHGEVLVGAERLAFDGFGQRDHSWGVRDWWAFPWCWSAGRLGDGTVFHGVQGGPKEAWQFETGYVIPPGGSTEKVDAVTVATALGDEGLPESATVGLGEMSLAVTPLAHAPMLLESPDLRRSRFPRSLCRFGAGDGRAGFGWVEWLQPEELD